MKQKFQFTFKQFRIICLLYPFIIYLLSLLLCFIFHEGKIVWEDNLRERISYISFEETALSIAIFCIPTFTLYLNLNKKVRQQPYVIILTFIPLLFLSPYILWIAAMAESLYFFPVMLITYVIFYFFILRRVSDK